MSTILLGWIRLYILEGKRLLAEIGEQLLERKPFGRPKSSDLLLIEFCHLN